jgi:recombination protein RecR
MQKNQLEIISKLISKLPGMGPRIAKRLVLYLANNKEKILLPLIENLKILNEKISNCKICGNLDEGEICHICLDEKRDQSIICVVEEVADLWAIERAGDYHGKYHILGGNLSATSGKKIEDLNINSLIDRVRNNQVKEIIIATSATIDGQTTSYFITDLVKEYNIKITRLTYGIPVGSELDYLDEGTISIALKTRTQI